MDASERARVDLLREWLRHGDAQPVPPGRGWPLTGGEVAWLLDALATAERERDEARAEARAAREHMDRAVDEIRRTLPEALRLAAEDEREACAAMLAAEADARETAAGQTDDDAQHHDLCTRAAHLRGAAALVRARWLGENVKDMGGES